MRKLFGIVAFASGLFAQIPVTDPLVVAKCSGCHSKDEKGNLSRISWVRSAPEGWQQAIKRMVRLHGVSLKPEEARKVVQYLSDQHGLAPEEAKPGIYYFEKRHLDQEKYPEVVRDACVSCHPYGQAMNWRRDAKEWDLLVNMHIGFFPVVEWNSFRGMQRGPAGPPVPGADTRTPVEKAIEQMKTDFPLETKEWAAWTASRRQAKLAGRWLLSASQPGKGRFTGEVTIEPGASPNEWVTRSTMTSIESGQTITREGKSALYTGYSWRGRSGANTNAVREVMMVSRDQSMIEGRWFWGAYDEFGYDVKLVRTEDRPVILATSVTALRAGKTTTFQILGDQFPTGLTVGDLDLGAGITIKRLGRQTQSTLIEVEVEVAEKAPLGPRDLAVKRTVAAGAIAVYDTVDYIKTASDTAIARLGGGSTAFNKGYMQFEAIGFNRGLDGKPNTPDDINLGPVKAEWSLEEFFAVYGDDDVQYVGTIDKSGYFTPSIEGPNPKRKFSRNNYGDVWAVATYKGEDAAKPKDGSPITAKCYLVVTVPQYMRWDQPEVAQ
ncbi:MAG: quinohemoprotein amine dehydrogenase subunit alpha [Acidobacteria bacterium]|nr:quinohemoprotein amine dehydrogenase subunit alpha [Acidobacteriota bacterium]